MKNPFSKANTNNGGGGSTITNPFSNNESSSSSSSSNNNNSYNNFQVFCSCLPGLEPYLYNELLTLGIQPLASSAPSNENEGDDDASGRSSRTTPSNHPRRGGGGVAFTTQSLTQLLSCHLYLGTASHILLRATPKPFQALGMEELYRKVSQMPFWMDYIHINDTDEHTVTRLPRLDIRVSSSKSRLFHTVGIAERVERGIWDALGVVIDEQTKTKSSSSSVRHNRKGEIIERVILPNGVTDNREEEEEENVIKILVRLHRNQVEISIDTSTTPLHKRGYRLEGGKAPLREDLAYALLYSAGWGHHLAHHHNHPVNKNTSIHMDSDNGLNSPVLE